MLSNINKNWIWHKTGNVEVHALIIFMGLAKYPKISDYWSRYFIYQNIFHLQSTAKTDSRKLKIFPLRQ